jgi:hypothetical protein
MKKYKLLFIVYTVFTLTACAQIIKMGSSKGNSDFNGTIDNMLIVIEGEPTSGRVHSIDKNELRKISIPFNKHDIRTDTVIYTQFSIEPSAELDKKSKDYEYVLFIKPTAPKKFLLNVENIESGQKVWAGTITVPPATFSKSYERFEAMGEKILRRMHEDKVIELKDID